MKFIAALFLLGLSIQGHAQNQESLSAFVICRNGKVVRTIRLEPDDKQVVCIYTRQGVDREVGRGFNRDSIYKILKNVQGNLEEAGWACKEATKATIIGG